MSTLFSIKLGAAAALPGYLQGLAQPCVRVLLHFYPVSEKEKVELTDRCFDDNGLMPLPANRTLHLSKALADNKALSQQAKAVLASIEPFNNLLVRLQESAGCPVCSGGVIEQLVRSKTVQDGWSAVVLLPSLNPAILLQVIPFVLSQINGSSEQLLPEQRPKTLTAVLALLSRVAPRGHNTRLLLHAAFALNVPVCRLSGQVFRYGWGVESRWMDSSFTDAASGISARLARDKVATHHLLSRAGFPVAEQVMVADVDEALKHANRIGYPVVIKPADLDGGKGVEAGLNSAETLESAFERATNYSKNIILERHIEGRDYRLGVLYGRFSWATYREPAGVWGDGHSTLQALIDETNSDPERGSNNWSAMEALVINVEAKELIAEQEVSLNTVIAQDCFIRLRRAANTSSGGKPIDQTEQVHPDNALLAEQVAQLFRLDIAGIDFICADITRSWRDVGGVICEVNGQPQFSLSRPDISVNAIRGLVNHQGRVPVVVILAPLLWGEWALQLQDGLVAEGITFGLSLSDGLWLGDFQQNPMQPQVLPNPNNILAFADVQAMQLNTSLQAMIIATEGKAWLQSGLPLDKVDLVISDKNTDPKVLAMLTAAGRPTCWQASHSLTAAVSAPENLQPLTKMIAEHVSTLIYTEKAL